MIEGFLNNFRFVDVVFDPLNFYIEYFLTVSRIINTMMKFCSWTKCLKNQPCNVKKMREMREKVGKKTLKKEMDNHFYDVIRLIF